MKMQLTMLLGVLLLGSQVERVPEPAILNGVPQGMFVGRSLLSGRAVCLLFLSGGRITRAIPEGGLESFDWNKHRNAHGPDSGVWQMRGGQLVVTWGDGGVHQGPITVHPDGIEFYGKRYSKPQVIDRAALAGRWESARGTALTGGAGINRISTLVISADGRYQWVSTAGGAVEGRAVASDRSLSGTVTVRGLTISFTSDAGATSSHTLLPAAGAPVTAFSVDGDMFTRSGSAASAMAPGPAASTQAPSTAATSPGNSYQGIVFTVPAGWTSTIQQGRLVVTPQDFRSNAPVLIVVSGAERLSTSLDAWLDGKMAADLAGGTKVLQSVPSTRGRTGGYDVISAVRTVQDPRGSVMLQLYYAFTDGMQAGLALTATGNDAALKAQMPGVQAFLQALRFSAGAATPAASSLPPSGAASTDSRSVTAAELVGHWDHASSNRVAAPAPADAGKGYAQGYVFNADGTYTYAFTGLIDRVHFNESDRGTWAIENGLLVVRSRSRSVKAYQIIQFRTGPDGSSTMTLLLSAYPPTDSNINVWGEKYLRKK